ncbi:GNAT family N-acetyltransferase [Amphritea japonica]|uniref:N-acetyltransferase n=1 Tax=Amphritea japonica ATCC BAA-1530 TaxID=1278309 RepID=A0A7R6PMM6_9GAMM|nr:GNAT family N-acetyltransferase [Amphritea japonica]BBB26188.1 N-acetyltransferase [Amphritea japonica ATCC BAA-1530]
MSIDISLNDTLAQSEVIDIYRANVWSAADKPEKLMAALKASHSLVTARDCGKLIGLGNAISDGHLVVYYPHLLVLPEYQGQGVGKELMRVMQQRYQGFHQQMLTADGDAVGFYQALGFTRAGKTEPMWVYAGNDH